MRFFRGAAQPFPLGKNPSGSQRIVKNLETRSALLDHQINPIDNMVT